MPIGILYQRKLLQGLGKSGIIMSSLSEKNCVCNDPEKKLGYCLTIYERKWIYISYKMYWIQCAYISEH